MHFNFFLFKIFSFFLNYLFVLKSYLGNLSFLLKSFFFNNYSCFFFLTLQKLNSFLIFPFHFYSFYIELFCIISCNSCSALFKQQISSYASFFNFFSLNLMLFLSFCSFLSSNPVFLFSCKSFLFNHFPFMLSNHSAFLFSNSSTFFCFLISLELSLLSLNNFFLFQSVFFSVELF